MENPATIPSCGVTEKSDNYCYTLGSNQCMIYYLYYLEHFYSNKTKVSFFNVVLK